MHLGLVCIGSGEFKLEWVMPKMKTNRGAAKRLHKTGKGKVKHGSAFKRHLLSNRTTARKRGLRGVKYISPADRRAVEGLLPY